MGTTMATPTLCIDDETTSSLGVTAKTSHAQGDNGGEADRLEEEDNVEKSDARVSVVDDGRSDEDDAHGQENQKDLSWPAELHEKNSEETTNCKCRLRTGKELGTCGV
ncbi:hypothetical protein HG530_011289 [Fusarium avenaceum]|nr:hypothetical protein HG530_011289 [Fusarium avenaceum]